MTSPRVPAKSKIDPELDKDWRVEPFLLFFVRLETCVSAPDGLLHFFDDEGKAVAFPSVFNTG